MSLPDAKLLSWVLEGKMRKLVEDKQPRKIMVKKTSQLSVENRGYLVNKLPAACLYFDLNVCQVVGAGI